MSNLSFSKCVFDPFGELSAIFIKFEIVVCKLFTTQFRLLITLKKKPFENIVGTEENAGNQHFLHFPQCFLPFPKQISIFPSNFIRHLQML